MKRTPWLTWMVATTVAGWVLALAALPSKAASVEDTVKKTLTLAQERVVKVDLDRGAIEVTDGPGDEVVVEVWRKASAWKEASAKNVLQDHTVTVESTSQGVEVRARSKGPIGGSWWGGRNLQVRCKVTMPQGGGATLNTAGGSVSVTGLKGKVRADTAGGSLTFKRLGGAVVGRTSGGSIEVEACKGGLDVETSGGGLDLSEVEGTIKARTSGGSVRVVGATGDCELKTSGGSITVRELRGSVNAGTGGGSVTASFAENPKAPCTLKTSGGSIEVTLPASAAVELDAHTSGGRVTSDLPVTVSGEVRRNALAGPIGGGGPKLLLRTSGGSIRVKRA